MLYAQYRYDRDDYPAKQEISVRYPDGTLMHFVVYAEQTVEFRALRLFSSETTSP
jgi:hypothetical protein